MHFSMKIEGSVHFQGNDQSYVFFKEKRLILLNLKLSNMKKIPLSFRHSSKEVHHSLASEFLLSHKLASQSSSCPEKKSKEFLRTSLPSNLTSWTKGCRIFNNP